MQLETKPFRKGTKTVIYAVMVSLVALVIVSLPTNVLIIHKRQQLMIWVWFLLFMVAIVETRGN